MLAFALCLVAGCGGGGVSQSQFDKLKIGMTRTDVEGVLGKENKEASADDVASLMRDALATKAPEGKGPKVDLPDLSGARGLRWGDDKKSITVIFMGDRAQRIFKKGF